MDKTKNQVIRILNSLILIHKKVSASQARETLHEEIAEILSLYKIIKSKYPEKEVLLNKIYELIVFCNDAVKCVDDFEETNMLFLQKLEEILVQAKSEKFDKMKVLFLPYKVSMWDSMESIYLAAKQNADCQVDVMPIPYFNIDENREVISMKYEGALFPKELQITDYKHYFLEEENPDVIFIHNPYDDCNHVTQVPPHYYSSNLTRYTKHLCYVPYDIAIEETFNEDLCRTPGVQNAWRVFVQSQTLKERYAKYIDENKILCLGSPKIDSMVNGLSHKENVPKEWVEKCNGRQVFLLNTHLSRLINADKVDLQFFKELIVYLKENDHIVVIWRPHPLIIQTIKSVNPKVLEVFQEIVNEFKSLPNTVYDDTADMHTAIELSDAYFGDGGSLLTIYGATGKPMFLCDGINEKFGFDSSFSTARMNQGKDKIWAFCKGHNALYSIDFSSQEVCYELSLPTENFYEKQLYMDIIEYKNWLYMLPFNAKDIIAVDKNTHDVIRIKSSIGNRKYRYSSKIVNGNQLIITPACNNDTMMIVDMDNQTVEEVVLVGSYGEVQKAALAYAIGDAKDGKVYIPSRIRNEVLIYTEEGMHWHKLDNSEDGLWQCKADEEYLWILPKQGTYVYRCTYDFKDVKKVDYLETITTKNIFSNYDRCFGRIVDMNSHIWLTPFKAKFFLRIDKKSLKYDVINLTKDVIQRCLYNGKGYFGESIYNNGFLYLPSYDSTSFTVVDVANRTMKVEDFTLKNKAIEELHNENKQKDTFKPMDKDVYRYSECSFEYFSRIVGKEKTLTCESRKKNLLKGVENTDGTAGEKIWAYVYNEIKG